MQSSGRYIDASTLDVGVSKKDLAQSARAVEYTDCISEEGKDTPNECPGYDAKQSDGESWSFGEYEAPLHCHHSPVHSGLE